MKRMTAAFVATLSLIAMPSASFAQKAAPAAMDAAFQYVNNTVRVAETRPGGTAELMGLRAGDIITSAGGVRINSEGKLMAFIRRLKVGDPVALTVKRAGTEVPLSGTALAPR